MRVRGKSWRGVLKNAPRNGISVQQMRVEFGHVAQFHSFEPVARRVLLSEHIRHRLRVLLVERTKTLRESTK